LAGPGDGAPFASEAKLWTLILFTEFSSVRGVGPPLAIWRRGRRRKPQVRGPASDEFAVMAGGRGAVDWIR